MTSESDRLPPIPLEELNPAQRRAAEALTRGPRGALFGPFVPLLRSPELLDRAQRLGEYLRYDSAIPARLRELAILLTARHFGQRYEWHVHAPVAAQTGLAAPVIAAIAGRRRPEGMPTDESVIYDFCTQLHERHAVSDGAYAAALELLGEQGVMDLCGVCGYYGLLALVMNVARTPVPAGSEEPWPDTA
jgi:4-carboxymuconolactone decarboxylase